MRVWSRGLGKMTLELDLKDVKPSLERDRLVLRGKIGPPVNWDFWIKISEGDVPSFVKLARRRKFYKFLGIFFLSIFRRKK
jgi:hypothetical protein